MYMGRQKLVIVQRWGLLLAVANVSKGLRYLFRQIDSDERLWQFDTIVK